MSSGETSPPAGGRVPIEDKAPVDRAGRSHGEPLSGGGGHLSPDQQGNSATVRGCRLAQYAEAVRLPREFLRKVGLSEISYDGAPAVKIPYHSGDGTETAARFCISLNRKDRFRWRKGSKPCLYGLNRVGDANEVTIVTDEIGAQILWFHGFAAICIPGFEIWNDERDALFLSNAEKIYIPINNDDATAAVKNWLCRSSIGPRAFVIQMLRYESIPKFYLSHIESFKAAFKSLLDGAESYQSILDAEAEAEVKRVKEAADDLVLEPNILNRLISEIHRAGLVGEDRNVKLLYLALTSRVFDRPVSIAVKEPSSGGKSHSVESVLKFFPPAAYWSRTSMSERALAYSDEDFRHRHLVIFEATGLSGEFGSYLLRRLMSEGRIEYETIEKVGDGMKSRVIRKEGPTGLIITTTSLRLHPENETRLLTLNVNNTTEQTTLILKSIARGQKNDAGIDYSKWQHFQIWLEQGECRVVIPFAEILAGLIPPVAIRLRRDFKTVLSLIRAHALLHREHRKRDDQDRILASADNYIAIYELIRGLLAEGIEDTVKPATRETVVAVAALGKGEWSLPQIAEKLRLDKSTMSRRVRDAIWQGFLVNREPKAGMPLRVSLGKPLPEEIEVLPTPDKLEALRRCTSRTAAKAMKGYFGWDFE
jgi:hypothetical protein